MHVTRGGDPREVPAVQEGLSQRVPLKVTYSLWDSLKMGQSERLEVCCCCRSKFLDIIGGGVGPDAEEVVDGIFKVICFLFMLIVNN